MTNTLHLHTFRTFFSSLRKIILYLAFFLFGCYVLLIISASVLDLFTHPFMIEALNISENSLTKIKDIIHIFSNFAEKFFPETQ